MHHLTELDDLALVRQIQHGNEAAMTEFYERFAPGLISFIRRKVYDSNDIEDILSETMTAAVTSIMRFKGESRVFSWLCRIAQFKIVDYYRNNRRKLLPYDECLTTVTQNEADLETNLLIWEALFKLKHDYRLVLQEKYFAGFSTREIAGRLGRTEKAIESILTRARHALANELHRLDPDLEV